MYVLYELRLLAVISLNGLIHSFTCAAIAFSTAYFGEGTGTIVLDDVRCLGTESTLLQCSHVSSDNENCNHFEDAGVRCA